MSILDFQSDKWYHSFTLFERISLLKKVHFLDSNLNIYAPASQKKVLRWKSQFPFNVGNFFTQRLAMDGITENEFIALLSEPIETVINGLPDYPDWLLELIQAFSRPVNTDCFLLTEPLQSQDIVGLLNAIEPLISQGREQLQQGIQTLMYSQKYLPFDPNKIEDLLFINQPEKLLEMLSRALVLELHVARLQGFLQGETPVERFRSFIERLRQREVAISLLQEYPVLARQIVIHIQHWVNFSLEFLQHLCNDWKVIQTIFSPESSPGYLVELQGGAGDSHRSGRSVLIAKFSSGFKLVYKPRSLAVDVHFQELLIWLNQRGNHPPFHTLKVLNRHNYGWVEFVTASGCNSPEEIQRFYERQGGYIALLYALKATDFHSENLIAAGEHPVLIDLESLFHPRVGKVDITQSDSLAAQTMAYSVLSIGLLPQRLWTNGESEGIEMSGLSGKEGQLTPDRIPYWESTGTDEMRLKRERMKMPGDNNRPTLNSQEINVVHYIESIVAGFTNIYQLLIKHRDELLLENSPLARFAEDEVRVILRSTHTYSLLLNESWHPDLLRNALDRDRFFDTLWVDVKHIPSLAKVIPAEREDLYKGDIPVFTTRPNSRHLWSSSNQLIADFLDESSLALVYRRLQSLSDQDQAQQLWFIRAALLTLVNNEEKIPQWSTYPISEALIRVSRVQLLEAACVIGDRLEFLSLRGEADVSWLGITYPDDKHASLTPLGIDLYDGLPGVALFLAYLGAVTQKERYTELARAALKTLQRIVEANKSTITRIGGFDGWGGLIYTLTNLGILWNEPALLAEAETLVELLPDLIFKDEHLDMIGGAAGCLGSLISLYRCQPSQRTLTAAIQCGDQIISQAQTMEHGVGWLSKGTGKKPLSGFSHGAAGIAWALLELASLTGEKRFQTTALAAIEYERSLFRPELGNWPDLRDFSSAILAEKDDNQPNCMTAWCHGAPGIGLGRLRSLPHIDDAKIRTEIDTALKTTLAHGFGSNHSLCHGDLGNLELLLQASLTLDHPQWHDQVNRLASIILVSINQHGWLCGVPLEVETPGLMTGLAGIGYGLLRLAEPTRVPSVLVLEPPLNSPVVKAFAEASAR